MGAGAVFALAMIVSLSPFILWMIVQAFHDLNEEHKDNKK